MSGKKLVGRGLLRAQARNLKRAWRRVQGSSSLLVEQLLQHLSLAGGAGSMNVVYERLQQPEAAELAASCGRVDDDGQDCCRISTVQILPPNIYDGNAGDDDDEDDNDPERACCLNMSTRTLMQRFPYPRSHRNARLKRAKSPRNSTTPNISLNRSISHSSPSRQISPSSSKVLACSSSIAEYDSRSGATVLLKISIVGDAETGKTSFMAKYVWPQDTSPEIDVETVGVATQEKVVHVKSRSTHIAFSIWDLGGHWQCGSMLPIVCRDAAAILIMFDLTRRSTLNSVMDWFVRTRECNKAAIAVMVGTKYDHFVELPLDIQRAVIQQARVYARAMGAPLFFSSATHNINVHKVFKVIVAKLFDLPCPIPINLNFGEPLVDY